MTNNFHTGYRYDRCISRGICSINPTTASLQEVILIYLKHAAYYGLKLKEHEHYSKTIKNLVLNTLSILSSNYEISKNNFNIINSSFKNVFPNIIKEFEFICNNDDIITNLLDKENTLNDYIRLGEKEFNKRVQSMPVDESNLLRILFILIKSLCINILTFESFGKQANNEIIELYQALNLLNSSYKEKEELKENLIAAAKKDCELMDKIRQAQEELYGKQNEYEVSFSTQKGKAILVVGSNLKELEQILNEFKNKDIDIYTHDNMLLAHTFPIFKKYKNLKGQFGQGIESCLLDFSTFPGPIILTRNSLFNIENLYRGRLFTTDFAYTKGVIPIKNNDFSEVIKAAEESKGFKKGKKCKTETVGFNLDVFLNIISKKLSEHNYKKIIFIGINGYTSEESEYFETFIKHVPNEILIVSLYCHEKQDNLIYFNVGTDVYAMYRLIKEILNYKKETTIFIPFLDRHTLSIMVNLSNQNNRIYIGNWNQTFINPNISEALKNNFSVFEMTSPKKDLDNVIKEK